MQHHSINRPALYHEFCSLIGYATKRLSDSAGLVNQSVGLVPFYHRLPSRLAMLVVLVFL